MSTLHNQLKRIVKGSRFFKTEETFKEDEELSIINHSLENTVNKHLNDKLNALTGLKE